MGVSERFSNTGSFFESNPDPDGAVLARQQIDVTQPRVVGLDTVTDPLVPSRYIAARLPNFDPEIFDLRESSHLMRLLRALLGAAGIGGYQRSLTINRMGAALSGTHFADLDSFWGALFGLSRAADEHLPLDPITDVGDSTAWDAAHSRDASYRNRIHQLAKGFSHGGTHIGMSLAAEALLNCEVDLLETWVLADNLTVAAGSGSAYGNTWAQVQSINPTWAAAFDDTYGSMQAGVSQLAVTDRSEIVISPHQPVSAEARLQALDVLELLKPAGTVITVLDGEGNGLAQVAPRSYWADSNDWDVVTAISPNTSIIAPDGSVYASPTAVEAARPAFGRYSGESWSYNSRVSTVTSYTIADGIIQNGPDYQAVTFADGSTQDYKPGDSVLDVRQVAFTRLSAEGVQTTFPYSVERP